MLGNFDYNTVEGIVLSENASVQTPMFNKKELITFRPHLRYGFHNTHFNAWASLQFQKNNAITDDNIFGNAFNKQTFELSGGKRVSQFNSEDPITPSMNDVYTLFEKENYMKIYENYLKLFFTC